jgi:hypothetical protein
MVSTLHCAANNADLYQAVFRAHNIACRRTADSWISNSQAPPYYSNFVTLSVEDDGKLLSQISKLQLELKPPFTVKDSFAILDLAKLEFDVLFDATWISRSSTREAGKLPHGWRQIFSEVDFERWRIGWTKSSPTNEHVFIPKMLFDPELIFFAREEKGTFTAGCLANRSANVIGLSNMFYPAVDTDCFNQAVVCIESISHGLPIVGYEHGEALQLAHSAGFQTVGPLRVWIKGT